MSDRVWIDMATVGQRRLWLQMAAKRFAQVSRAFRSKEVGVASRQFMKATATNRTRGQIVLRRAFSGCAWLEYERDTGPRPLMLWSAIAIEQSPLIELEKALTPDEKQDAAIMHYVVAARCANGSSMSKGHWELSATLHSLGRLIQRFPAANIDEVLLDAHRRLLAAPSSSAQRMLDADFLLPTTGGAFLASANVHIGSQDRQNVLHVRARTWLADDMLHPDQLAHADELLGVRPDEPAMLASVFAPARGLLRRT